MKLKTIFEIIQGHQITDEELYRTQGDTPVLTGKNQIKGYWDKQLVNKEDLPCITYPTKANSGEVYVQNNIFDANNTAVLIPYPEWREKLNLDWCAHKISRIFLEVQTSKEGVSYLNREIVEELDVDIPKRATQDAQYATIFKLIKYSENINKIIEKISRIKKLSLVNQYKKYQIKQIPINMVLNYMSGNSGLTERFIYQKSQSENRIYTVLSGSTGENTQLEMISICELNGKPLKIFQNKEGLLIIRKGKAGTTKFLKKGKYTITDDAYILYVKDSCSYKIHLKWLSIQYGKVFLDYASSSDNGTWNMGGFFENVLIDVPDYDEQIVIVKEYEKLENYENKLKNIIDRIQQIFTKTIV